MKRILLAGIIEELKIKRLLLVGIIGLGGVATAYVAEAYLPFTTPKLSWDREQNCLAIKEQWRKYTIDSDCVRDILASWDDK